MRLDRELACAEVVELVTAYLDGRLAPTDAERFEEHLALCDGCATYLEQIRVSIAALGELRTDDMPSALRESLLEAFRDWKQT